MIFPSLKDTVILKPKRKEVITMPGTKGNKNRPKTNITKDYASQIAEKRRRQRQMLRPLKKLRRQKRRLC